jgi:hypothetical protein
MPVEAYVPAQAAHVPLNVVFMFELRSVTSSLEAPLVESTLISMLISSPGWVMKLQPFAELPSWRAPE